MVGNHSYLYIYYYLKGVTVDIESFFFNLSNLNHNQLDHPIMYYCLEKLSWCGGALFDAIIIEK